MAVHPDVTETPSRADLRDRATGRPLRPLKAERDQLRVRFIGTDLAPRGLDPFLDLRQERIRDLVPIHRDRDRPASVAGGDMFLDRVMGTAR